MTLDSIRAAAARTSSGASRLESSNGPGAQLRLLARMTRTDIATELGMLQAQVSRLLHKALAAWRASIVTNNR